MVRDSERRHDASIDAQAMTVARRGLVIPSIGEGSPRPVICLLPSVYHPAMALSIYDMLNRKRKGLALPPEQIIEFIDGFVRGDVADYQMTAFLMAVAIHGMSPDETAALTRAMLESGEQWKLHDRFDFVGDKHSTGGVGDKISMVLTPWVASCGVKIAMLSGRGLGHTGGTLDKLESIPGFNARLSRKEIERCLDEIGCAIATSTERIAPADRRIYALRDVTGTVESIPLITASIMSKKLAMGATGLVLDVKTGRGAFMQTLDDSRALARGLLDAARGSATRVEALITDMERPLGRAVGNANEIDESFAVLRGEGPDDIRELTRAEAIRLLAMTGRFDDEAATAAVDDALSSGRAREHAQRWVAAQGGDPDVVDGPAKLPRPRRTIEVAAPRGGYITDIDTHSIGMFAVDLGAGRKKQDDVVDHAAGITFEQNRGDEVREGSVIAKIELGERDFDDAEIRSRFLSLVTIADDPPTTRPLIVEHLK